jgi:acetyltransferase-like isoleucine patch superfamily enzyme
MSDFLDFINRVYRFLRKFDCYLKYGPVFGAFHFGSILISPSILKCRNKIKIGKNVVIERNAVLYCVSSYAGVSFNPEIIIDSGVYINYGFNATTCSKISIGKNVTVGPNVFMSTFNHGYTSIDTPVNLQPLRDKGHITIGDGSWIGNNVTIIGDVKIGRNSVIGAGSVVVHDVADYSVAVGSPAKVVKRFNGHFWENCL